MEKMHKPPWNSNIYELWNCYQTVSKCQKGSRKRNYDNSWKRNRKIVVFLRTHSDLQQRKICSFMFHFHNQQSNGRGILLANLSKNRYEYGFKIVCLEEVKTIGTLQRTIFGMILMAFQVFAIKIRKPM